MFELNKIIPSLSFIANRIILLFSIMAYANDVFEVYVSPSGNDAQDGRTIEYPVNGLERGQDFLKENDPITPIEIHIKPGTYISQKVIWDYKNGNSITFTALNFSKERPVYDGQGDNGTWFILDKINGEPGKL